MTALATQADARFVPSLLDAPADCDKRNSPNYTVDTLTRLRDSLAASSSPFALFALLGADSWLDIARWYRAPEMLALCDWIVAARPGYDLTKAERAVPPQVVLAQVTPEQEPCMVLSHSGKTISRVWILPHTDETTSATNLRGSTPTDGAIGIAAVEEYVRKTHLYTRGAAET